MLHASLLEEARHLRLKKRFSQNFLVDESVHTRITGLLSPDIGQWVEIGAGAGFLTKSLLQKCPKLMAIELERDMIPLLREKFQKELAPIGACSDNGVEECPKLTLVAHDVLAFPFNEEPSGPFGVVGNLPYAIASPLIFQLIGELSEAEHPVRKRLQQMVVMVQREVAERMVASPGSRAYGTMAISCQQWFHTEYCFTVPPNAFYPAPKVHSAVVCLTPRSTPKVSVPNAALYSTMVHAAFRHRRKTLLNNLLTLGTLPSQALQAIILEAGFTPLVRAEQISMEAFGHLADVYAAHTGKN
jgi:16S rRNA (adenine1518-N6/adenine1519-N6)-dimethyltransferase